MQKCNSPAIENPISKYGANSANIFQDVLANSTNITDSFFKLNWATPVVIDFYNRRLRRVFLFLPIPHFL